MENVKVVLSKEEIELLQFGLTEAIYRDKKFCELLSSDPDSNYVETRLREIESLEKLRLKLIRADMGLEV